MSIRGFQLGRFERAVYFVAVVVISTTHYLLAPILTTASVGLGAILAFERRLDLRRATLLVVTVILAWLGIPAVHYVATGKPAYATSSPHIFAAKLYTIGLVDRFAREHCPDPSLQLCSFRGPLAGDWNTYLWGGGLMNHLGGWNVAGPAEMELVHRIAREYPLQIVSGVIQEALKQTVHFSVAFLPPIADENTIDYSLKRRMPRDYLLFERSRQQKATLPLESAARASLVIYGLSFAVACAVLVSPSRLRRSTTDIGWRGTVLSIIVFALANDFVSGGIGEVNDRYGSRVMPLLVLAAAVAVARLSTFLPSGMVRPSKECRPQRTQRYLLRQKTLQPRGSRFGA
jgi:hypothetical protein